jgi:capsular exopolysaccharide synthesis family protein
MNRRGIEYSVLVRDVEGARQLYDTLLQRSRETGVAGELRTSNIRIVDAAEQPRSAASPQLRMDLLFGVLGGLLLALAVVFFLEYIDNSLKSPEEVKACLGLPSLGMLPELKVPAVFPSIPSDFLEALRAIRLNVLFSLPQKRARTLAVTSTGPNEGKTTTACNLAMAFAMGGQRVLLIDADMRRCGVHKLFDLEQEPGLSNVLVGDMSAGAVLRKTDIDGLWTLTAGRTPPNPAELLGSPNFQELIDSYSAQFDTIIVDTPPVGVVADPSSVATVVSGVVFVVGAEMTNRHAARAALEQLRRGHARVLGVVLNRVQLKKHAYYYSRYYHPTYAEYYSVASS